MKKQPTSSIQPLGPRGWANWRLFNDGLPHTGRVEAALYSDSPIVGQIQEGIGPYQIFNAVPLDVGASQPALFLRIGFHLSEPDYSAIDFERTSVETYLGGWIGDEIAFLLSLALEIRCRCGGITRRWWSEREDPLGTPSETTHRRPYLPPTDPGAPLLPQIGKRRPYDDRNVEFSRDLLNLYPRCDLQAAVSLARAARLYAEALWIAEDDPQASWISLVSAVEVAAAHQYADEAPRDRLCRAKPALFKLLESCDATVLDEVANSFPHLGATSRFLRFIEEYGPPPPDKRPEIGQLDWTKMKNHMQVVYEWRSKALHGGIPIPLPMCERPRFYDNTRLPAETPLAATASGETTWRLKDTPMLLWTFAYIVRRTLLSWSRGLARDA